MSTVEDGLEESSVNEGGAIADKELAALELPDMSFRSIAAKFGPGIILMMTGIGTSHIITAPTAGGRFGYALLWCIPIAYIFKYYGFEMAFRFTNATGKSLIEAYATTWKKWPLWYVMITTLIQCVVGQAGRLIAASAVLYFLFTVSFGLDIGIEIYAVILGVGSVLILLRGNYQIVEKVAKTAAGLLFVATVAVFLVDPPPLSTVERFFTFETPEGSWLIVAAFLGLLPTGIDVSLQASEWGKAKKVGMGKIRARLEETGLAQPFDPFAPDKNHLTVDTTALPEHALTYCRRWFTIGLWDFRIGHLVSFIIACIFLILAAIWLYPSSVEGQDVIGEIAKIFTLSVGPWMMMIFMLGAFAATFSTAFNYFDGWPRIVGACCRNIFRSTASLQGIDKAEIGEDHKSRWYSEYNIYRATMVFSLAASLLIIIGIPRPVFLVLVASALAFFVAPIIYFFNIYYCMKIIPKTDKSFYPSKFAIYFSAFSLIVFTGLSALLILARVFKIALF
ncbi:MAG: Nramp family divalent metal transporter [Proteobacteria bacterium]|jgi:Mn2+/Fe2+ NRAMP family transporter|nr:Nramp family divalent metal transporter [Pseudomonadota bacterium]